MQPLKNKLKLQLDTYNVYIMFAYYFGKILGLLPIKYCCRVKYRRHELVEFGEFRICKVGITISIIQFFFEGWTCYVVFKYLIESAMMRTETLCSQGHYCSAFGILLSHTVIAIFVVAIVPFRLKKTISCFNQANYVLFKGRKREGRSKSYFAMIPFVFFIVVKIIISNIGFHIKQPELYYPYNISYFGPLSIIYLVGVFCNICKEAYDDINKELELLSDHCFSLDILLVMLDIYVQLVLFLYVTLWAMFAQKTFSGLVWPHAAGLLEVIIITIKLVYLCDRCDRAVDSGNRIIFFLQHLSSVMPYNSNAQELIKIFTLKVNCRKAAITASGFFTINLRLLVRIIGVVLTYFLVLIQFQVDGDAALNVTKSDGNCPSWPCLKPI